MYRGVSLFYYKTAKGHLIKYKDTLKPKEFFTWHLIAIRELPPSAADDKNVHGIKNYLKLVYRKLRKAPTKRCKNGLQLLHP